MAGGDPVAISNCQLQEIYEVLNFWKAQLWNQTHLGEQPCELGEATQSH